MKKYIFREYDVRGIYPTDLNEEDAFTFGHAFASYIKKVLRRALFHYKAYLIYASITLFRFLVLI